jgi:4-amino-4-deoxy-L-arabinose transferase-like glycosyltransferase
LAFVPGIVVFLILTLPWFVLVQMRNPDFFHFFFIVQQFDRYLTPDQHRPGPVYYFVPIILIGFLPWISLVWRGLRASVSEPRQTNGFRPVWLLMVWTAFIFVFFSASHSKLLSYVLPIAPAIALLLAMGASTLSRTQWQRHLLGYSIFLVAAGIGAMSLRHLGGHNDPNILYRAFAVWVFIAIAVAFVLTLVAFVINFRSAEGGAAADDTSAVRTSMIVVGLAWLSLGTIAGSGHEVFGRQSSGVLLAPAVKAAMAQLPPDTPFYSVNKLDHTMPFYIGHTMIMVHGADELQFGVDAEPQKWVSTVSAWITRWTASSDGLALMGPDQFTSLQQQNVPMFVVARDVRRVIVSRSPLRGQN